MAGADPGFSVGGGLTLDGGGGGGAGLVGAPAYHFAKFSKKLHDTEKILGRGGGLGVGGARQGHASYIRQMSGRPIIPIIIPLKLLETHFKSDLAS